MAHSVQPPVISCHLFVSTEALVISHSHYYGHITSSIQFLHPLPYLNLGTKEIAYLSVQKYCSHML